MWLSSDRQAHPLKLLQAVGVSQCLKSLVSLKPCMIPLSACLFTVLSVRLQDKTTQNTEEYSYTCVRGPLIRSLRTGAREVYDGGAAALPTRPHLYPGGCRGPGPGRPLCSQGNLDACECKVFSRSLMDSQLFTSPSCAATSSQSPGARQPPLITNAPAPQYRGVCLG